MKAKIEGKAHILSTVFEGITYEGIGPTYFTALKELERVIEKATGRVVVLWK